MSVLCRHGLTGAQTFQVFSLNCFCYYLSKSNMSHKRGALCDRNWLWTLVLAVYLWKLSSDLFGSKSQSDTFLYFDLFFALCFFLMFMLCCFLSNLPVCFQHHLFYCWFKRILHIFIEFMNQNSSGVRYTPVCGDEVEGSTDDSNDV